MALRRSTRTQAASTIASPSPTIVAPLKSQKRVRNAKVAIRDSVQPATTSDATGNAAANATLDESNAAPVTPAKRRKTEAKSQKVPPVTPTPAAIGAMLSRTPVVHSTGDIDDAVPSTARPADPHRSNAPLHMQNGEYVVPNTSVLFPSTAQQPTATTGTLLDKAIKHLLSVEPSLKRVIDANHCRIFDPEGLAEEIDPFRSLASGIMAQQVSGAAASAIKGKFIHLFPATETHLGPPHFPSPQLVAVTPLTTLRTAGLSQRKAEYIQGMAEKFVSGELSAKMLAEGTDEEVMQKLVAVRGLGAWSVEMFCCFGLKRMDVFSTGDLGVQRGMAALIGRDVSKLKAKGGGKWKYMSEKDMIEIAEKFRPYR